MDKREMMVGDIVVTEHEGVYMISEIVADDSKPLEKTYLATTLDSDYIGTLCYYRTEHKTILSLLKEIQAEEGIKTTIRREMFQLKLNEL